MENIRTYNIHALLVIGGFEVRGRHRAQTGVGETPGVGCSGGPCRSPTCGKSPRASWPDEASRISVDWKGFSPSPDGFTRFWFALEPGCG